MILCGGSTEAGADDGLDGLGGDANKRTSSSTALDKFTMQEKIVPLIKAIKTKEPAVMMAALNVLRIVGRAVDAEFVAVDILPVLWSMSLGPLLNLRQFQGFMDLIRTLSRRVEEEQTRKLQDLSGSDPAVAAPHEDFVGFGGLSGTAFDQGNEADTDDFESLVKGKPVVSPTHAPTNWDDMGPPATAKMTKSSTAAARLSKGPPSPAEPTFSWSTAAPTAPPRAPGSFVASNSQLPSLGASSSALTRFEALSPSQTQFSQPMQPLKPTSPASNQPASPPANSSFSSPRLQKQQQQQQQHTSVAWSSAAAATSNPWASPQSNPGSPPGLSAFSSLPSVSQLSGFASLAGGAHSSMPAPAPPTTSSFALPPPPPPSSAFGILQAAPVQPNVWASLASRPAAPTTALNFGGVNGVLGESGAGAGGATGKSGLDKYESLL